MADRLKVLAVECPACGGPAWESMIENGAWVCTRCPWISYAETPGDKKRIEARRIKERA